MAAPTVIQGPAYVKQGSKVWYTEGTVRINYQMRTWNPRSAAFGPLGPRMRNRVVTVSFKPVGMVTAATATANYLIHNPANVGASILSTDDLVVAPLVGNKITFNGRAGISRMPNLKLCALATVWDGDMEFTVLGDSAVEPTTAAYWQTIAATTADTSFDETQIISPRYTAAWGVTYTGIEPDENGFVIEPQQENKELVSANDGVSDVILAGVGVRCRFRPLSLSETEMAAMIALQGATARLPGAIVGQTDSLVITGTGLAVTLPRMGPTDAGLHYAVGEWRQGEVVFENKIGFTVGVPSALWSFA